MHRLALSIFFAYFLTNKSIIYRKSVFLHTYFYRKSVFLFAYFIGKVYFCISFFIGKVYFIVFKVLKTK